MLLSFAIGVLHAQQPQLIGGGINYQKAYDLYQKGGNDELALSYINEGIKSDQQYKVSKFEYLSLKATILFFLNRNEECIKIATEAIDLKKEAVRAYYFRGLSYFNLKNDSLALKDYNTAIKNCKDKKDVYYELLIARAGLYNNVGKYDFSILDCNNVINDKPNYSPKVYVVKALSLAGQNNFKEAKENCRIALQMDPNNEEAKVKCEEINKGE